MNPFMKEYRLFGDDGDKWSACMGWACAVCDYLTDICLCPEYWDFTQSPFGADKEDLYYKIIVEMIDNNHATIEDLLLFSDILYKYRILLKNAGMDY